MVNHDRLIGKTFAYPVTYANGKPEKQYADFHQDQKTLHKTILTAVTPELAGKFYNRDRAMLAAFAIIGGRRSEILSLTKSRIIWPTNEADGFVQIYLPNVKSKLQKERKLMLPYRLYAPLFDVLKKHWYSIDNESDKLFPISGVWAWQLMKLYLGRNYSTHWFRHYLATFCVDKAHYDAPTLQQRFGWKNLVSAQPYLSMNAENALYYDQKLVNSQNAEEPPKLLPNPTQKTERRFSF